MIGWVRRTASLQRELAAIADLDPRWWLLAGGVAFAEVHAPPELYLASDAGVDGDTLMGYRAADSDPIERARAARTAIRELDGTLPEQPLAVTVERDATRASALDVAAFAIGRACLIARLDDPTLPAQLAAVCAGATPTRWSGPPPFVCVSIGDEVIETARHGHRRAWSNDAGPWLGLGRADGLAIVSTCHMVVDGYGHARLAARIAALSTGSPRAAPPLAPVTGVPLGVVWRELASPTPRAIPLAYAAGKILYREGRFSPTIQIPVARGHKDDPLRLRRRVVSATTSVRFERGEPEPYEAFARRLRATIAREANAAGLVSRLLAAARAVPVPTAWKRRSIGAQRPPWMESFAEVIGGRALLSRIAMDTPVPPLCAVSSPSRLATGCVVTIVDDGERAAVTLCGASVTDGFLDELLATA